MQGSQSLGQARVGQSGERAALRQALVQAVAQQPDQQQFAQAIEGSLPSALFGECLFVQQLQQGLCTRQVRQRHQNQRRQ